VLALGFKDRIFLEVIVKSITRGEWSSHNTNSYTGGCQKTIRVLAEMPKRYLSQHPMQSIGEFFRLKSYVNLLAE
jgi:hypothetical protein